MIAGHAALARFAPPQIGRVLVQRDLKHTNEAAVAFIGAKALVALIVRFVFLHLLAALFPINPGFGQYPVRLAQRDQRLAIVGAGRQHHQLNRQVAWSGFSVISLRFWP
jgi:hypothetical protein